MVLIGKTDPSCRRYTNVDIFRGLVCVSLDSFFSDEATQINGMESINDLTGLSLKHQTMLSLDDQKTFFGGWHVRSYISIARIMEGWVEFPPHYIPMVDPGTKTALLVLYPPSNGKNLKKVLFSLHTPPPLLFC